MKHSEIAPLLLDKRHQADFLEQFDRSLRLAEEDVAAVAKDGAIEGNLTAIVAKYAADQSASYEPGLINLKVFASDGAAGDRSHDELLKGWMNHFLRTCRACGQH